jgi:plastocyanin
MLRYQRILGVVVSLTLVAAVPTASSAKLGGPRTLVVGVDHLDQANQQQFGPSHRNFEYDDFFSRQVTVHPGDTLNFRAAPGSFHIVALAKSEAVARAVYPVAFADKDGGQDAARGSGSAKIVFGPSNFPITGGSTSGGGAVDVLRGFGPPACGDPDVGQPACTFKGGSDIEVAGPNPGQKFDPNTMAPVKDPATNQPIQKFVDWNITIDSGPGSYAYFCYIHPGMRGKLQVVGADEPTTTQDEVDRASDRQFKSERAAALESERDANVIRFSGEAPGSRTYSVHVGIHAAKHVSIDEMLPNKPLHLEQGDRIQYLWSDPNNFHSVRFPNDPATDPEPFGFDCGATYIGIVPFGPLHLCLEPGDSTFEAIGDPGNSPPGTPLAHPGDTVDSGVLGGTGYGTTPSVQRWSIATSATSQPGTYQYHCTIHDWMVGTIKLASSNVEEGPGPTGH